MTTRLPHICRTVLLLAMLLMVSAPLAFALNFKANKHKPFYGELEWRFADYESDSSDGPDFEASHFVQRYALLYRLSGDIYNSRAGFYNGGLGFEWWDIDTTYGDEDISLSNLKLLYNGEVLLAPGGLPFRLHLFAYDRQSAQFYETDYRDGVLDSRIITDVNDGEHQVIGGTLIAGIRNGSYGGEYREYLSRFPKLYIDFRQDLVRDLESTTPEHYRNRNLAFVSLNKKDNWFHYRFFDHKDYTDSDNDYSERTFQLGTVDHVLYRQWIWLTNWMKLSTDGSFTTTDYYNLDSGDPEHIFDYNLFLVGKRNGLSYANFNTFTRSSRSSRTFKNLEVPLYLTYDFNPDRSLYFQAVLERDEDLYRDLPAGDSNEDSLYLQGKLETGKISPIRFDPSLEFEVKEGTRGRGQSIRGGAEYYTNPRYRANREWLLAYSIANFRGNPAYRDNEDVSFLEQTMEASFAIRHSPALYYGGTQSLVYGSGDLDYSVSSQLQPVSEEDWFNEVPPEGDTLHSITELFVEHTSGRLGNRLSVLYDYLEANGQDPEDYLELRHRLRYENGRFQARMKNELQFGDQGGNNGFTLSQVGSGTSTNDGGDFLFESHSDLNYRPNRHWSMNGFVDYLWQDVGSGDRSLLRLRERTQYTFFHVNGIMRRWLELRQEIDYEQSWEAVGDDRAYGNLTLSTVFYPTYNMVLLGSLGYEWYDPGSSWLTYGLGMQLDYPLFRVEARYDYGVRDEDDGDKTTDHRWELNIKKVI